jgi:predicted Zn-dependent peptidase
MTLEKLDQQDSGLSIYVDHMPEAYTNTLQVVVDYGSVQERPQDEGVAHALEHGVMVQTRDFSSREALRDFTKVEGVWANAATNYQRTLHITYGNSPDAALRHLGEVLTHPTFDPTLIKDEMRAVRHEAKGKLADFGMMDRVAVDFAMFGVPAGRRIMGRINRLHFGAETLRAAHERNYGLANMTLIAAGAVTAEEIVSGVGRYFEDKYPNAVPDQAVLPPRNAGPRSTGLINPSAKNVIFSQSFPMSEGLSRAYQQDPLAFEVAARALRETCFRQLRFEHKIAYDGWVRLRTGNHPDCWSVCAQATTDAETIPIARQVFRDLFEGGAATLGSKALISAQKMGTSTFLRTLHSPDERAGNYAERLGYRAEPEDPTQSAERLRDMTLDEVKTYVDTLCEYAVSTAPFEHLTGNQKDVSRRVERVIQINEIG